MKMMLPIFFALLVTALPAPAVPATETFDVRGVKLGMTEAQLREIHQEAICDAPSNPALANRICSFKGYGPDASAFVMITLVADQVTTVGATFKHSSFSQVLLGLKQKYGKPGHHEIEELSNAMGATFNSTKDLWTTPDKSAAMVLTERAGKIDQSRVMLTDMKAARETNDRIRSQSTDNL